MKPTDWGKAFEKRIIHDSEALNYTCIKVPEEVRSFYGKGRPVQVQTPFDFCAGVMGRAAFFDGKACGDLAFNIKSNILRGTKAHQLAALQQAEACGNKAGYLIWFYTQACFAYLRCGDIQGYLSDGLKSINPYLPGIRTQPDNKPLDIKRLIFGDELCTKS
ncbi:MAG: hypothetical protein ACXABY_06990 [Candidatus Thorarchaeota archaeon]|jgi:hypothetical protein